ncbi:MULTISPECIES: hypothetical protein [unclassified Variovorax]|uniref:hypothetical protein n=1 Tax=unclassified Variovorax TaxID=663243 RepID=UPI001BD33829|nr:MULTISPECIES: hypothetical protein [unclassified Variovorax]
MTTTCGIFGFEFTQPFTAAGLTFTPLYSHPPVATQVARDPDAHHLTGTVHGLNLAADQVIYRLEAVLSFIEHLDVRLSEPTADEAALTDPRSHFDQVQRHGRRHNGGGAVINPDWFAPHQRARHDFIQRAMDRLADDAFCEATKFRLLFIKASETFRQRQPFMEVTYFLLYSGLEAYARKVQNHVGSNAVKPIVAMLKAHGFDVCAHDQKNHARSMTTYWGIRNAIFHNGELAGTVRVDNVHATLPSEEYLYHLQMLVCLTIMKAIGFEDAHRNWDCWIDYKPHGNLGQFPSELEALLAAHG